MKDLAIILAKTRGGLRAVADAGGKTLIDGTEHQFDTLTTYSDPQSTAAGVIDTADPGWVALAE